MKDPRRPVVRNAARVLLVDPEGRLLLLRGGDPSAPDAGTWWITPGGGLEAGEDAAAAAVREVEEETGHRLAGVGAPVFRRSSVFPFDGRLLDQRELYFVAHVPAFVPHTAGWTALERRELHEQRWWTLDELRETADTVYPETLADLLERALRG